VVVQTFNPGSAAIRFAARHDPRGFAEREMAIREESGLPPFARMARIVCRDEDAGEAERRAREIAQTVRGEAGLRELRVRGPMPCPIARLAGFHRISVEFLAESPALIQQALARLRAQAKVKSDAKTAVDVDPVTLV
jgi:primosomal protein N' (replication factor Y)